MNKDKDKIRVLLGKVGMDAHDRGVSFVASMLRDAGIEVVYLGRFLSPEAIAQTALQEDVDIVGLSFLSGEYNYYVPMIIDLLKSKNIGKVAVILGGLIYEEDIPELQRKGVKGVFRPGSTSKEIVEVIRKVAAEKRAS